MQLSGRKIGLLVGLLVILTSQSWAQSLSPIEKALRALAEKQLLTDHHATTLTAATTSGNTGSAQALEMTVAPEGTTKTGIAQSKVAPAPSSLAATNDPLRITATATAEDIFISWGNTANAWAAFGGYQLTREDLTGDHAESVTTVVTPLTSYRDLSVTAKTYYRYQVSAVDKSGNTLISSTLLVTQLLPSQPPKSVAKLTGSSLAERVHLQWDQAERTSHQIKGYLVYRKQDQQPNPQCLNPDQPVEKGEYYDETGRINDWYDYYVVAIDTRGLTSTASNTVTARARMRDRNGLILMSSAYRGLGKMDKGLNADILFSYYIGTLYGEQDPRLSKQALYLDPISLWLLSTDIKYTILTEAEAPVAVATGFKGGLQLFAGQQSASSGQFTFSEKSEFEYLYGSYLSVSRSWHQIGFHGGYLYGNLGNPVFFLSKYLTTEDIKQTIYFGLDFPIVRRMNAAIEILFPRQASFQSDQHPFLINLHVDRLFNFDVAYLQWDQGWSFLGYFNIRFTLFPGR